MFNEQTPYFLKVFFFVAILGAFALLFNWKQLNLDAGVKSLTQQIGSSLELPIPRPTKTVQFPVLSVTPQPQPTIAEYKKPSIATQKWLIAAGGIISAQNDEGFDRLKIDTPDDLIKPVVSDQWDIYNHDDAINTLNTLSESGYSQYFEDIRTDLFARTGGDEKEFQRIRPQIMKDLDLESPEAEALVVDLVWKHKDDLAQKKLIAWDKTRLMNVARWSYSLGYISEKEAWSYMLPAGQDLQNTYSSWNDIADNYLIGRAVWAHTYDHPQIEYGLNWIKNDPQSPWKTIPWKTKLE